MAEIDFDELDKAVHSLMKDANSVKPAVKKSSHKASTKFPPITHKSASAHESHHKKRAVDDNSTKDKQEPTRVITAKKTTADKPHHKKPAAQSSVVAKRRGKFMDMKPAQITVIGSGVSGPSPKSRVGVNLKPVSDTVVEALEPETTEQEAKDVIDEHIEFPNVQNGVVDVTGQASSTESAEQADEQTKEQTAYSPFLTGAKVEKRPLGLPPLPVEQVQSGMDLVQHVDDDVEPASVHGPAVLPKELHSSVLEVEAHTTGDPIIVDGEVMSSITAGGDEYSRTEPELDSASIHPRYESESRHVSLSDEPRNSIYDDGVDHSGLNMHKNQSNWFVVVMIILLLLLGATGGAVVYLYQTGAL